MEAIILAGGYGTRLQSVVSNVPKPMAIVNGRPFLEYLIDYWRTRGVSKVILAVGYKGDQISAHFGPQYQGLPLDYSIETEPLGTGGGIAQAQKKITGETFLVLNGDTFVETNLLAFTNLHHLKHAELTFTLVRMKNNSRYGKIALLGDGEIKAFHSAQDSTGEGLINAGAYLMNRSLFRTFDPGNRSLENDFFPQWLSEGRKLFGMETEGKFIDIGIPEDYRAASGLLTSDGRTPK